MSEGVDALGHPDPAALGRAGKVFVGQYLKNLTRAQAQAYLDAGIGVFLLGETTGRRSLGGYATGVADAQAFLAQADAIGAPDTAAIYIAETDFDATASQIPTIAAYYKGAQTVLGARCGGYGGYRAVKGMFDAHAISYGFQTYAWSHGKWDSRAQLQQYLNGQSVGGTAVDYVRSTAADFGAWEAQVALTNDDAALVARYVWTGGPGAPAPSYANAYLAQIEKVVTDAVAASGGGTVDAPAIAAAVLAALKAAL